MERERRFVEFNKSGLEIEHREKLDGDNEPKRVFLRGFAALFETRTELFSNFFEEIEFGFFRRALSRPDDIFGLFNHDENFILGEKNAGTMKLREVDRGLWYEIDLADTQTNRDRVISPIERGELKGSSFGFTVNEDGDDISRLEGHTVRTLLSGGCRRLYDASPVTYPAYVSTDVEIAKRSFTSFNDEQERQRLQALSDEKAFLDIKIISALNDIHLVKEG